MTEYFAGSSSAIRISQQASMMRSNVAQESLEGVLSSAKKKAVIVGVSYIHCDSYRLDGSANDAVLFANSLVHLLDFYPTNIVLLTDGSPASCYIRDCEQNKFSDSDSTTSSESSSECTASYSSSEASRSDEQDSFKVNSYSSHDGERCEDPYGDLNRRKIAEGRSIAAHYGNALRRPTVNVSINLSKIVKPRPHETRSIWPTRHNILKAINWLVRGADSGDVLIFYFAGHSVQVDNMSGFVGEGYDEALVPCDYQREIYNNLSVLTTTHLKELLLNINRSAQITIILDCNGGQTILDPAGTMNGWTYIKGVKQKGLWPLLTNPTNKMRRAVYRKDVWDDEDMRARLVRPRYIPGIEVDSATALCDPLLMQASTPSLVTKGYCLAAAPWPQCAVECAFESIGITHRLYNTPVTQARKPVIHGVFTYCLVESLKELLYRAPGEAHMPGSVSYNTLMLHISSKVKELKASGLFKLDQSPEVTICTGGATSPDELFAVPFGCRTNIAETNITGRAEEDILKSQIPFSRAAEEDFISPEKALKPYYRNSNSQSIRNNRQSQFVDSHLPTDMHREQDLSHIPMSVGPSQPIYGSNLSNSKPLHYFTLPHQM